VGTEVMTLQLYYYLLLSRSKFSNYISVLKRPQLFSYRRSISQLSIPLKKM